MTMDVAVIGGGVSGLATAYELMRRGHSVVVLERQVRAGGNAVSERIGGFLMEHGPSSVNAASDAASALSQSLGLENGRCDLGPGVRYRYLVGDGCLHRMAAHPLGLFTSDHLTWHGRLRILAELLVPPNTEGKEETVAQFFERRFGHEFADRVIDPLVGGLFAADAAQLSMPAAFPKLLDMERRHGSITRAAVIRRLRGRKMPGRRLYSWREGIGTLPMALASRLGSAVRTGATVRRIKAERDGFRIDCGRAGEFEARVVVVATQPHVAAALFESVDAPAAEAIAAIEAPPIAVVFLGYRRGDVGHPLDGLGYLTPSDENRALNGALFCSTMFAHRAPEGHVALAGYIGGARQPELAGEPPAELIVAARSEFRDLLGARGKPVVARVQHWPRGLPQCRPGHGRLVAKLLGIEERRPGLFVTGNYFNGPSVGSCIAQAGEVSARVHQFLAGRAEGKHGGRATQINGRSLAWASPHR